MIRRQRKNWVRIATIWLWMVHSGCASTKTLPPQRSESLSTLKQSALDDFEAASTPRFSKKAISDAEMLQGLSPQAYRDSLTP
jgi:hypothetical protein